ncbi:MAG TPA: 5'-3' exonuclease [Egibacteraceae bacterium]|nr:5'-3' exonuclease [Egibacteraceae bacterium]
MAHLLLLDAPSLTYRAYFALPTSITAPDGRPVNAVRGYLDMTARLVVDRRPDDLVHAFDHDWRPAPRVRAYPGYKAQRPAEPEGLVGQFSLLREVLDAAGQTRAHAEGWEAEDAIGTLCAQAATGDRLDVVTGDRDLIQLVRDPGVRVLFTVRGVSQLAVYDEAGVHAKYGIPPGRYVDFAVLRGDPSDGLPGVKGVGEKTARGLVRDYPSLEALLDGVEGVPPRLAERLRAARDYLTAMRQVVPIRCDLHVELQRAARDDARLDDLARRHNLEGPIRRLREALDG